MSTFLEEQMKHFAGLEDKIMSYLRTHLPLRGGGRGVCGGKDGSHLSHKSRGWLTTGDDLSVWRKHLGIS